MKQVQAVIFDLAGTVVDFGSFAPTTIFVEAFRRGFDFDISLTEARVPMGLGKWDHIKAVGELPEVAARWLAQFNRPMTVADINIIYDTFMPLQIAKVEDHAELIPHTEQVMSQLRSQNIKIGACTGYPRAVLNALLPALKDNGFNPDYVVATDDLIVGGRPAPYMVLKNMIELGVDDVKTCVKVDDSPPGIMEGKNAGVWTVALLLSGNEAGMTLAEYQAADLATLAQARDIAQKAFSHSKPDYMIDTIADLPTVIREINEKLASGERPS
ncbi:phosphonoacetaldehyde hydrolase [Photobacterium kishitanii]|uniref:phosphonoacetaldehyde hydrolase n=1 Tax=Photobacterium kishitanii TaxID=318456 RepID=UPI0007F8E61C|nr:phosphonoacetaldehyde hydrolase [Photobacterium kishitanii]OBU32184.1 phosphonoacetaldehyde hydrolase [Photobacterium kishitanii]PSW50402.1 phosphonoacetaldehyde hydrolase [Photobacterium kishitanii]